MRISVWSSDVCSSDLYGEFLRELLVPLLPRTWGLWLLRTGIIVAFVLHIHSAYSLTRMNRRANAGGYKQSRDWQAASAASRTMRWSGVLIGLFVLFPLAALTWGTVTLDFVRGDASWNFLAPFSRPPGAIFYLIAHLASALPSLPVLCSLF